MIARLAYAIGAPAIRPIDTVILSYHIIHNILLSARHIQIWKSGYIYKNKARIIEAPLIEQDEILLPVARKNPATNQR